MAHLRSFLKKHGSFILFVIAALAFRWSVAAPYKIPSGSMIPTLLVGDQLFVNKMSYDLHLPFTDWTLVKTGEPRHGEVVIFDFPGDRWQTFIKRMIGLPGDRIRVRDGFVWVNGRALEGTAGAQARLEEGKDFVYVETVEGRPHSVQRLAARVTPMELEFTVPEGQYFVMGDNRDDSHDGRFWGFVPRSHLRGRAVFHLFRFDADGGFPWLRFERSLSSL